MANVFRYCGEQIICFGVIMRLLLKVLLSLLLLIPGVSHASIYAGSVTEATGAYAYVTPLIKAKGSGLPFYFRMDYISQLPLNRTSHWQHNFAWKVIENPDLSVTVYKGDVIVTRGNFEIMETFNPPVAGSYTSPYMTYSTLTKSATNFVYTTRSLTTYTFNLTGKLLSIVDANGNTQTLSYDANGNLATVVDSRGNTANFSYDVAFNLLSVGYGNFKVSFTYDATGNLSSIADLNGNTTSFTYDASGRLLTLVGPDATTLVQNTYDATSRITSQVDAKGASTTYAYAVDVNNFTTLTKTDRLGRTSKSMFDVDKYAISKSSPTGETLYSASTGPQKMVLQEGAVPISLDMDRYGNVLTSTKSGVTTTSTYDAQGRLLTTTKATGETATMTYDTKGNLLSRSDFLGNVETFLYDGRGNVISKIDGLGNTSSYIYSGAGDVQALTDAAGNTTKFTYDLLGRLLTMTLPSGAVTSFTYDKLSHLLSAIDGLGQAKHYVYDVYGQVVSISDAKGAVTSLTYDAIGNVVSVSNRAGKITTFAYDAENNVTSITDPLGNVTTRTYDAADQLLTTTDPFGFISKNIWGDPGLLIQSVDSAGVGELNQYNQGLLTDISNSTTGRKQLERDANGRIAAVIDGLKRKNQLTYNGNDQLTGSIDAANKPVSSSYDVNGKLLSYTDAGGNTTRYSYDARGLRVSETDAKGNITQVAYNVDGLLASRTLASGSMLRYGYDAANRLISISSPGETISYTLDANGNRTKIVSSLTGTISQTFDAMDRVSSRTDVFGNRVTYSYDANGNMTTMTYPDGKVVTYTYDGNNRMISVTDWAARMTSYTYVAGTGRMATRTLPDGSVQTYSYDGTGRLASLSDKDAKGAVIYSEQLTIDAAGQITSINETAPVLLARQAASDLLSYDAVNQLLTTTAGTFTYDTDGNLISQQFNGVTTNMAYNAFGHLMNRGADSYRYDATGLRIESTLAGITTRYAQENSGKLSRILMEQDNVGATTAWNVYGQGLLYRIDAAGNPVYYHFNHLGTTMALTNTAGAVTDAYAYNIYGRIENRSGTTKQPFTYHGQWGVVDDGHDFYYMRARYYDALLQRFITRDNVYAGNLARSSSLNRHVFVEGNPVLWNDPKGETILKGLKVIYDALSSFKTGYDIGSLATQGPQYIMRRYTGKYGLAYIAEDWAPVLSDGIDLGNLSRSALGKNKIDVVDVCITNNYCRRVLDVMVFLPNMETTLRAKEVKAAYQIVEYLRHMWKKPEPTVQPLKKCGTGETFFSVYREAPTSNAIAKSQWPRLAAGIEVANACVYSGCDHYNRRVVENNVVAYECKAAINSKLSKSQWDMEVKKCNESSLASNLALQNACIASIDSSGKRAPFGTFYYVRPAL